MRRVSIQDIPDVARWHEEHGKRAPSFDLFPDIGFIEPDVAAGFLYRTDSALAMIDGVVTNPKAGLRKRAKAVECITAELLALARQSGFRLVIGLSASRGVHRTVSKLGFRTMGVYALMEKGLQ